MIVFPGSKPTNPEELRQLTRGINGSFCFHDDCSLWKQCQMDTNSNRPIFTFFYRLFIKP